MSEQPIDYVPRNRALERATMKNEIVRDIKSIVSKCDTWEEFKEAIEEWKFK